MPARFLQERPMIKNIVFDIGRVLLDYDGYDHVKKKLSGSSEWWRWPKISLETKSGLRLLTEGILSSMKLSKYSRRDLASPSN